MRRSIVGAAIVASALLAAPSAASAHYYMGKAEAANDAWDFATERYGVVDPGIACRPQGADKPAPGYDYHRWVCGWYEEGCGGAVLILGARSHSRYYYRVLRGERCD
jgi:hypothetical protein